VPVQPGPDLGDDPIHCELVSGRPSSLAPPADRDLDVVCGRHPRVHDAHPPRVCAGRRL